MTGTNAALYSFADIRRVHLEITSRCNAACPMCARNVRGGAENPVMPEVELTRADIERIFAQAFLRQLDQIWLCGNYGDPIVSRDLLEVLEYFRRSNPAITLGLNTNGSARRREWWSDLAKLVDVCQFGIDGLADTNHLYRRHTCFETILRNAGAFIEAGGMADWEFIVFRHNEHQIEEARQLALTLGFRKFRLRRTGRFLFHGVVHDRIDVLDEHGKAEYALEPPTHADLLNPGVAEIAAREQGGSSYRSYLESTEITCKAAQDREIFVTAEGLIFPCCYLGHLYPWHKPHEEGQIWRILEKLGGRESVDAKRRNLREIVEGQLFQEVIPGSWSKPTIRDGRIAVCAGVCGSCKPVQAQYTPSLL